jgi:hypothetical protein
MRSKNPAIWAGSGLPIAAGTNGKLIAAHPCRPARTNGSHHWSAHDHGQLSRGSGVASACRRREGHVAMDRARPSPGGRVIAAIKKPGDLGWQRIAHSSYNQNDFSF